MPRERELWDDQETVFLIIGESLIGKGKWKGKGKGKALVCFKCGGQRHIAPQRPSTRYHEKRGNGKRQIQQMQGQTKMEAETEGRLQIK